MEEASLTTLGLWGARQYATLSTLPIERSVRKPSPASQRPATYEMPSKTRGGPVGHLDPHPNGQATLPGVLTAGDEYETRVWSPQRMPQLFKPQGRACPKS